MLLCDDDFGLDIIDDDVDIAEPMYGFGWFSGDVALKFGSRRNIFNDNAIIGFTAGSMLDASSGGKIGPLYEDARKDRPS